MVEWGIYCKLRCFDRVFGTNQEDLLRFSSDTLDRDAWRQANASEPSLHWAGNLAPRAPTEFLKSYFNYQAP